MATANLKKSVLKYIDHADDRLLKLVKVLMETYQEEERNYEIPQIHKRILDDRFKNYKDNPDDLLDWEEVKQNW